MIPFLKPYFNHKEFFAFLKFGKKSVEKFEKEFAKKFGYKFAVSFSSGKAALYHTLRALDITNSEIILPAYTCVVVAHAIVLSKNIPVFVDISLNDFNMDLSLLKKSSKTKAVIATSLFGYPIQVSKIKNICKNALIIHDSALAPGVKHKKDKNESDITLYSFNVRKPLSTLGGGMITANNKEIFNKIKKYRDYKQKKYSLIQKLKKFMFFFSQFFAFNKIVHKIADHLADKTNLLDRFLIDYSEDTENIPDDYFKPLLNSQARIGLVQLKKYDNMIKHRQNIAKYYFENLKKEKSIVIPPIVSGAIYSHYCARVKNRNKFIKKMRKNNISIGKYFDYSIPNLKPYRKYKKKGFPISDICSKEIINLPNHPGLKRNDLDYIIKNIIDYFKTN